MATTITIADSYSPADLSANSSIAFKFALIFVFLRFSYLHEVFRSLTGLNSYMLYMFGPPPILAVIFCGGLRRTFREKAPRFWLAFAVWMILAVPFSAWKGGSFTEAMSYVRTDFIMLPIMAGLATNWADCKKLIQAIAWAAVFDVAIAYLLFGTRSDRLRLNWQGSVANSNDFAAHLLLILPFVLFIVLKPGTRTLVRLFLTGTIILGILAILRTASRGALLAIVVTLVFLLLTGSARQRITVGVTAIVVTLVLITLLPADTWNRLTDFSESSQNSDISISTDVRRNLLRESIVLTLENPLFGVGPFQFINYGNDAKTGQTNDYAWRGTHNSYTQISSECGLPALGFYLAAIISTFALLAKIRKRTTPGNEISTAAYCITVGSLAYCTAAFFLNFGYSFEFLAISGLTTAIGCVVREHSATLAPQVASNRTWERNRPLQSTRPTSLEVSNIADRSS